MAERFLRDLDNPEYEYNPHDAEFVIQVIERTIVHKQGETLEGRPLRGAPFLLQEWQKFIIYNLLGFYHKGTENRRYKEAFIYVPRKNGKALSLDTEIPTPSGWKKMADIHVGDLVFGQDGKPAKVLAESEIFTDKEAFEVTFEDGEVIVATDDHIWTVITKDSRRFDRTKKYISTNGYFETTTKEMSKCFVYHRKDKSGKEYKYRVPMNEPVEYDEKELSIDPYMLGVWLGDGTSCSTTITCGEQDLSEMISLINLAGYTTKTRSHKNRATSIAVGITPRGQSNKFLDALRKENVLENKHIPIKYLQGSYYQRLSLLQGLMDTDGTISKSGQCSFAQSNRSIIDQVCELLSSLGIKNSVRERQVKCEGELFQSWEIQFFASIDTPVFRLKRKLKRQKKCLADRMKNKSIVNIKSIGNAPSKCIYVDNENHLFLAGKKFTATHNTSLIAALAWALALLERKSGSTVYVVGASLKQSMQSFEFIRHNLRHMGEEKSFRILDNNMEHSISGEIASGYIHIQALASNPDAHDSLNCNIAIADELHAYKNAKQYNVIKEAMKAYTNKLMIGITTAGDNMVSFCYQRLVYCKKILDGSVKDEAYFVFIAKADESEGGEVDYANAIQHRKANPSYGITIRPDDIMNDATQAQNDPQQRKDFLSKSLNIYTSSARAYFNLDTFRTSDKQYNWTIDELAKLPIEWFGGADLSKMHDLTAAALKGCYKGVDISITHAFFPITRAHLKADEDNIPLFGWQDDGWLTMSNGDITNHSDIVRWFMMMRDKGFRIKQIGFDRKFGEEFFLAMKNERFSVVDEPQLFINKSKGFRRIEQKAIAGKFYYLHSQAYEYCLENVHGIEKTDDMIQYEKVMPHMRIDLFDADVFATCRMIGNLEKSKTATKWLQSGKGGGE